MWFARGGYGTARLLDDFFAEIGRKNLPAYFGFSDATALFNAILSRRDQLCIHAPLVVELAEERKIHKPSLKGLMAGLQYSIPLRKKNVLIPGDATGRLLGGNLVVLSTLLGTKYFPSLKGAVLMLEEVGEEVYRIDRMLTQFRMTGVLNGLKGVLFGNCSTPKRKRFPPDRKLKEVLLETFEPLGIPLLWNLPFGHIAKQRAVPLGGTVHIEASAQLLTLDPQVHPRQR